MFGKKFRKLSEMLEVKTDQWGDMESEKIRLMERTIRELARESGFKVNFYDGSISKLNK